MASNVPSTLLTAHKPLSVLVEHDLSFVPLQRRARLMGGVGGAAARFAAGVAKKTECGVLRRFTHIVAMSQHDAALLQGINPVADVWVVPNGVDCTSFRPTGPRSMPGNAPRLLFAGGLAHYPNLGCHTTFYCGYLARYPLCVAPGFLVHHRKHGRD
jgi:glycosyltransferase involved in cell wall biosynthesis